MGLNCEVCGENLNQFGDLLVCDNGHTLTNTFIGTEGFTVRGKKQIIKKVKKKQKKQTLKINKSIELKEKEKNLRIKNCLIFFNNIFDELLKIKLIKNKNLFKYFTGFFTRSKEFEFPKIEEELSNVEFNDVFFLKGNENGCFTDLCRNGVASSMDLYTILYLQIRSDYEKEKKILLLDQFLNILYSAKFSEIFKNCKKKCIKTKIRNVLEPYNISFFYRYLRVNFRLKRYGDFNEAKICTPRYISPALGVLSYNLQKIKYFIRSELDYSYEIAYKYILKLLKCYDLDKTIDKNTLEMFLRKLIYTRETNLIFLPEIEYSIFLIFYVGSFCKHLYLKLFNDITAALSITSKQLSELLNEKHKFYLKCNDPEEYINQMNKSRNNRFMNLMVTKSEIEKILSKNKS